MAKPESILLVSKVTKVKNDIFKSYIKREGKP